MAETKPINLLADIHKGISQSYLGSFNKIVNLDIHNVPGAVIPQNKLQIQSPTASSGTYTSLTFTVDTTADELIFSPAVSGFWKTGQAFTFTTTGTLPAGLSTNTTYYALTGSASTRLKLVTTPQRIADQTPVVDITGAGTGTHTAVPVVMGQLQKIIPLYAGNDFFPATNFRFAAYDNLGKVWVSLNDTDGWIYLPGNAATTIAADGGILGIAYWKSHILVFSKANIDVFHEIDDGGYSTPTFSGSWHTLPVTFSHSYLAHPSFTMSNDILYIGDGYAIMSLAEVTNKNFDPTDATTYTSSPIALDTPYTDRILSLAQLGSNLIIGTTNGSFGKIYTWDTVSSSFLEPVRTSIKSIDVMISANNTLYFIDSPSGSVYETNGSVYQRITTLPKAALGTQQYFYSNPITIKPYAAMFFQNKIFIGVSSVSTKMPGVYSYDPVSGAWALEYKAFSGSENNMTITALCKISEIDFFAAITDSTYSGNYVNTVQSLYAYSNYTKSGDNYIETGLYTIGTKRQPKTLQYFEIVMANKLTIADSITLSYRNNLDDSYTVIGSMSYSADGAVYSKVIDNATVQGDQIQFKVAITSNSSTAPELKAIYVH